MIPTQKLFYPYTTSLPHPSFFLQDISAASSNHSLQAQLKNAFSAFPAQYNFPRSTPSYFPHMADALSLLKLQQHMQAQISALYSAKLPKIDDGTFSSVQTPTNKFYGSPSESSTHEVKLESETSLGLPNDPDICLEAQIKYIIHFFVNNSGRITVEEMQQAKLKYAQNSKLMSIFEALASKYSVITKTREEMIKWIIRRCLKMSKKSMKKDKKDQKTVLKDLCLRYFKDSEGDSGEEEESDMVDRVLPFRKNSKNKTMNTSFVIEIFQSEQFKEDYKIFLERFDEISEKENAEKVSRFTSLVLDCAKRGNFERIAKYKRVPWLKVWISNTKRAAKELDDGDFEGKSNKRTKLAH